MGSVGDPAQSRQRFALGACRQDDDVRVGDLVHVALVDEHLLGQVQVAQFARDLDVPDHGSTRNPDETVVFLGSFHDLADAVDVRSERGNDDSALRPLEYLVEGVADDPLGGHVAGPLGVGRVAEVREHTFLAQLGEAAEVHRRALYRRQVDLVVAGEQDQTGVSTDSYGDGAGYRVVDLYKFQAEATEVLLIARLDLAQVALLDSELLQLAAHEPEGELGRVDRYVELAQQVRQRPDVVLVTVREDDALQLACVLPQVGKVGQHQVDPWHLLVRERHSGVNQDNTAPLAHGGHVLADLTQPSEGYDLQDLVV